uniref:Uncharacterized protein n=1 Tax=Daphnia magna TaxID=35525 RepID=A0A0P6HH49_9CRUS
MINRVLYECHQSNSMIDKYLNQPTSKHRVPLKFDELCKQSCWMTPGCHISNLSWLLYCIFYLFLLHYSM